MGHRLLCLLLLNLLWSVVLVSQLLALGFVEYVLEVLLRISDHSVVANEDLRAFLLHQLFSLLLVENLGYVSILGLGVFSYSVDSVLLCHFVVLLGVLSQLKFSESHFDGVHGARVNIIDPLLLD